VTKHAFPPTFLALLSTFLWLLPNTARAQTDSILAMPSVPLRKPLFQKPMLPVLTGINTEGLLLYQGLTCNTNKHDLAKFQHYALCHTPDKKIVLKKTKIDFYTKTNAPQYTGLRCPDSDSTIFMLCTNKSLPEGVINGTYYDWTSGAIDYDKIDLSEGSISIVVDTDNPDQPDYWQQAALVLVNKKTRQQQILCQVERMANPTPDMIFTPPYTLHFYGDLDGDGRPDYIISGESGQAAEERLYLSSYAYRTELVREVARWNYCLSND
jgi:hypothetical protein